MGKKKQPTEPAGVDLLRQEMINAHKRNCHLTIYGIAERSGVAVDSLYKFRDRERDLIFSNAMRVAAVIGLELTKRK
jgi:hypothetical protein